MEIYIPIIVAVLMVLPLWWDKLFPNKKIQQETHKARVDALKCYDELTQGQAKRIEEMSAKVEVIVTENRELREQNRLLIENQVVLQADLDKVVAENIMLREENGDLREWADRLVAQVITLKGKPVKPRPRMRKENRT